MWLVAIALAEPVDELGGRIVRASALEPMILGDPDRSELALARDLVGLPVTDPRLQQLAIGVRAAVDPEDLALEGVPLVVVRGGGHLGFGEGRVLGQDGDGEPGLSSLRAGVALSAYHPWVEARLAGETRVDGLAVSPFVLEHYWLGLRHGPVRLGFGQETRWLGPGRHGSLMLSDNARPFPAGDLSVGGRVPHLGALRAELLAGWLQEPRLDVQHPGLLAMDFRWAPVRYLELGLSRVSLFGGEDRPLPGLGPLLLPLEPHVADDPDQELPDQDEIAALDARVLLPLPGGYLEVYGQYGGDDMVMRRVPSLAGVANLFGGELMLGPAHAGLEWARLMDDRFRWYTSHRIYHQGFTQDGRSMGHPNGGDSRTWYAVAGYTHPALAGELWLEQVRRVGVVDVVGDTVIALSVEEQAWRGGLRLWAPLPSGGRLEAGYEVGRVDNGDFVPGRDWEHRAYLSFYGAPYLVWGNEKPEW